MSIPALRKGPNLVLKMESLRVSEELISGASWTWAQCTGCADGSFLSSDQQNELEEGVFLLPGRCGHRSEPCRKPTHFSCIWDGHAVSDHPCGSKHSESLAPSLFPLLAPSLFPLPLPLMSVFTRDLNTSEKRWPPS